MAAGGDGCGIMKNVSVEKHIKDISGICFVVRPNFVEDFVGKIEFKEIKFQDNLITNL